MTRSPSCQQRAIDRLEIKLWSCHANNTVCGRYIGVAGHGHVVSLANRRTQLFSVVFWFPLVTELPMNCEYCAPDPESTCCCYLITGMFWIPIIQHRRLLAVIMLACLEIYFVLATPIVLNSEINEYKLINWLARLFHVYLQVKMLTISIVLLQQLVLINVLAADRLSSSSFPSWPPQLLEALQSQSDFFFMGLSSIVCCWNLFPFEIDRIKQVSANSATSGLCEAV